MAKVISSCSQVFGYLDHGTSFGKPSLLGADAVYLS